MHVPLHRTCIVTITVMPRGTHRQWAWWDYQRGSGKNSQTGGMVGAPEGFREELTDSGRACMVDMRGSWGVLQTAWGTLTDGRGGTHRQWLLLRLVLWLGDVQAVDEALQLLPEGLHLGVDPVEHLVLSDPGDTGGMHCYCYI